MLYPKIEKNSWIDVNLKLLSPVSKTCLKAANIKTRRKLKEKHVPDMKCYILVLISNKESRKFFSYLSLSFFYKQKDEKEWKHEKDQENRPRLKENM